MILKKIKHRFKSEYENVKEASLLLEKCNHLAEIVNTTLNEKEFYATYDKMVDALTELTSYEGFVPFINKPSDDLHYAIESKSAAIKRFNIRTNAAPIYMPDADPLFTEAAKIVVADKKATIGALQRELKIGFNRAMEIMNQLESVEIIGPENGTKPRIVLVDHPTLQRMLDGATLIGEENNPVDTYTPEIKNDYKNFDTMSGLEFEHYCAEILESNGFTNVEVTQGSGDHGIDILAEKDDITYAIQCKCYSSNIGNAAVQQAHTGKSLYHKDIAVVLTNQYFTQQAQEEAKALGVKLWDRDKLQNMINHI